MPPSGHERHPDAFAETGSRDNTRAEGVSGEGTYGSTLANPAAWLERTRLTGADGRPGQDCRSSYSAEAHEASPSPTCGASGTSFHPSPNTPTLTTPGLQVRMVQNVCGARKMGSGASEMRTVHFSPGPPFAPATISTQPWLLLSTATCFHGVGGGRLTDWWPRAWHLHDTPQAQSDSSQAATEEVTVIPGLNLRKAWLLLPLSPGGGGGRKAQPPC